MKKIERWAWRLKTFGRRYKLWIVVVLSLLLVVLGVFYGVLYGKLWLRFPEKLKAEIAINRLGVSSYDYPICHEACFYERQLYKQIIAGNLKEKLISERVKNLILAEENNLIFRLELLDTLSRQNNSEIPDYLKEYLNSGKESKVQKKIQELFGSDNFSVSDLISRFDNSSTTEGKIDILSSLQEKSDSSLVDFYLNLIIDSPDLKIKNSALSALSNLLPSEAYITPDFLSKIKKIIFDPVTNQYLRKEIILLLGDYLAVQEKLVTEILVEAYSNEAVIDKFSRLFAIDILNRSSANNYVKPEISASEWQEYRDHNSLWGNE